MTSTMFSVKVDRSDPLALHDQVTAEIRRAIAEGDPAPENVSPWPRTWPRFSESTRTRCSERYEYSGMKDSWTSSEDEASPWLELPNTEQW
jgi:hypothetical protein